MRDRDLFPAGAGSVLILVVLVVLVVFLLAWVLLWVFLKPQKAIKLSPVVQSDRDRWTEMLRSIPVEDYREAHLSLARTMRSILGERANRDLSSWTVADIAVHEELVGVAELLASWEEPSFAPSSDADAEASIEDAVREVERW